MIEQFREMLLDLAENPNIKILTYKEYAPLSFSEIEEIESTLTTKLPTELKEFYLGSNGLSFGWIHKDDPSAIFDEMKAMKTPIEWSKLISKKKPEFRTSYTNQSGSIEIKGIRDVFSTPFPMNEYLFEEGFYVLDAFSNISGAAISLKDGKWLVSFNSDYYTHFDDYNNALTFEKYLQFLLDTKGIKSLRCRPVNIKLISADLSNWPSEFAYYE